VWRRSHDCRNFNLVAREPLWKWARCIFVKSFCMSFPRGTWYFILTRLVGFFPLRASAKKCVTTRRIMRCFTQSHFDKSTARFTLLQKYTTRKWPLKCLVEPATIAGEWHRANAQSHTEPFVTTQHMPAFTDPSSNTDSPFAKQKMRRKCSAQSGQIFELVRLVPPKS